MTSCQSMDPLIFKKNFDLHGGPIREKRRFLPFHTTFAKSFPFIFRLNLKYSLCFPFILYFWECSLKNLKFVFV